MMHNNCMITISTNSHSLEFHILQRYGLKQPRDGNSWINSWSSSWGIVGVVNWSSSWSSSWRVVLFGVEIRLGIGKELE